MSIKDILFALLILCYERRKNRLCVLKVIKLRYKCLTQTRLTSVSVKGCTPESSKILYSMQYHCNKKKTRLQVSV